jgi:hypothetical protein
MKNFERNSDFPVFNIFPAFVTRVQNSDVQSTAFTDNMESAEAFSIEQVKS